MLYQAVELITETAALAPAAVAKPEGWVWEAEMLRPGTSLNGYHYTPEFIRQAAREFEGAPAFADHQQSATGSVRQWIGNWKNVRAEESRRDQPQYKAQSSHGANSALPQSPDAPVMKGELHLLESEPWMRDKLNAAAKIGATPGVSVSMIAGMKKGKVGEREVMIPERILPNTPRSADVVMFPSAGGRVLRAVAGTDFEAALAEARKRFGAEAKSLVAQSSREANSAAGIAASDEPQSSLGANSALPDKLSSANRSINGGAMEHTSTAPAAGAITESLKPIREDVEKLQAQLAESQRQQRVAESRLLLDSALAASKLPAPLAQLVRERYAGRETTADALETEIQSVRQAYAAMIGGGIAPTGGRAQVVMESADKMQIGLDKLLGVTGEYRCVMGSDEGKVRHGGLLGWERGKKYDGSYPGFRGIREGYMAISGDRNLEFGPANGRITEEWASAGFANALGNTLYRRLIQDYMEVDYGIDILIPPREPHRVALKDFRTHDIVRVGYLGDLPTVDPEAGDWPEIQAPTDEQATITAVQFGGLVTVTRKTIINDDLGLVAKVASRLGRAARRTMAQQVMNLIISNGNIYDGNPFFSAGHGNIATNTLLASAVNTARTTMRNQTEMNSGKPLGIGPYILLVPPALEGTAIAENERQFTDNNFTPNPIRYIFGDAGARTITDRSAIESTDAARPNRIIVSVMITDAVAWYLFANPDEVQTFELGFLQGKAEPELLLADNQLVGLSFTADRIQYKIRHEYQVTVVDYRGAYNGNA